MTKHSEVSVFITGANGGLGLETCRHLVRDGIGRLVLACRTEPKAEAARAELQATEAAARTQLEIAGGFDMTDPKSIEAAVDKLDSARPFDVVFLQAGGVTYGQQWSTVEHNGQTIERTIFRNVLGSHITLVALIRRGLVAPGARVVIAGGEGARGIPGMMERPTFDSPEALRDYVTVADPTRKYVEMNAMGVSKFAGALWALKAAELYGDQMDVVWFTPGLTAGTGGLEGIGAVKQWFFENVGFPLMVWFGKAQTAADGGRKFADCLLGEVGENGDLIGAPEGATLGPLVDQKPMNPCLTDPELRDELWRIVEATCGPSPRLPQKESVVQTPPSP